MTRRELANAVRILAVDCVEAAKSGHPGAPLGMADMAEALWRHALKFNPANPLWADRDRFVLSNGHASALLYAVLHLTGYELSMQDLQQFRQFGAKTAGHPEYSVCPGVEATTGPLGQGLAMAVGFALAERSLAATFNKDNFDIVNHFTWLFLGDGCLMEGISHEAASLAGTQKLGKLIALYDANGISIDGKISGWFADDTQLRFKAYGWQVIEADGHDSAALDAAIAKAKAETTKPSLIICHTHIGFGSTKVDSAKCHGSPLGDEGIIALRKTLNWPNKPFEIPQEIYDGWNAKEKGAKIENEWNNLFASYSKKYPDLAKEFTRRLNATLPGDFAKIFAEALAEAEKPEATRVSSRKVFDKIGGILPELLGGSADLSESVGTFSTHSTELNSDKPNGNYIYYGVREFAMGAIMNGLALHGSFIPYGGTFLIFSDYAKNAIRLAALMKLQAIWILTHDSIGLGEDGPTHQPVEQLGGLRLMPNLRVWRPCDALETAVAFEDALAHKVGPTCLSLSRQNLTQFDCSENRLEGIRRGGYILSDCQGTPDLIMISNGSELGITLEAAEILRTKGHKIRVVSMPCTENFDAQDSNWQEQVLPNATRKRIAIEASSSDFWYKYVGLDGKIVGMNSFGESAPANKLYEHFGFTAKNIALIAEKLL